MRTIYLVTWDNREQWPEDHRWGNIQAFNSMEDAERFIIVKQAEYLRDMERIDELEMKFDDGVITKEEKDEYNNIRDKWSRLVWYHDPDYEWGIEEIQFQE